MGLTAAPPTDTHLRTETLGVLGQLFAATEELDLPRPSEVLIQLRERLATDTYQLYLVSDAKRGKSTFVNALLGEEILPTDRKSTRLNSSHANISYAVFCLKKKQHK